MSPILSAKPIGVIRDAPISGEEIYVRGPFDEYLLMRIFEHGSGYGAENTSHSADLVYDSITGLWTAANLQPKQVVSVL